MTRRIHRCDDCYTYQERASIGSAQKKAITLVFSSPPWQDGWSALVCHSIAIVHHAAGLFHSPPWLRRPERASGWCTGPPKKRRTHLPIKTDDLVVSATSNAYPPQQHSPALPASVPSGPSITQKETKKYRYSMVIIFFRIFK